MNPRIDRRRFFALGTAGAASAAAFVDPRQLAAAFEQPGWFASLLDATPSTTEGPFYPDQLPLDTDNDLLLLNDATTPAVGTITHLSGRVLSPSGEPVRNAFVEIWQVDNLGSYLHSDGAGPDGRDANFQGYGRFLTDVRGQYYFRTIRPVPYGDGRMARVPHVHVAVSHNGKRQLTTQIGVAGFEGNDEDGVFGRLDVAERAMLMAKFQALPGSKIGEQFAEFDLVLGRTPEEREDGSIHGGIGQREGVRRGRRGVR